MNPHVFLIRTYNYPRIGHLYSHSPAHFNHGRAGIIGICNGKLESRSHFDSSFESRTHAYAYRLTSMAPKLADGRGNTGGRGKSTSIDRVKALRESGMGSPEIRKDLKDDFATSRISQLLRDTRAPRADDGDHADNEPPERVPKPAARNASRKGARAKTDAAQGSASAPPAKRARVREPDVCALGGPSENPQAAVCPHPPEGYCFQEAACVRHRDRSWPEKACCARRPLPTRTCACGCWRSRRCNRRRAARPPRSIGSTSSRGTLFGTRR